tara:strand:+ start:908 stop:1759 length:852 start_codon:yes stop_codon:yes gene_type:complete
MEKIDNKIFFDKLDYKKYVVYKELLNKPYEIQCLLYYKGNSYVPSHLSYYDLYEDEEKTCITLNLNKIKMGANSLYSKIENKKGITIHKKGRSNQKLRIWNGTSINDAWSFLHDFGYLNNFNKDDYITNILTKGMLSLMISDKITTNSECYLYYAKYSLKLKKSIIDKYEDELINIMCAAQGSRNNIYSLRNILYISKNIETTILHLDHSITHNIRNNILFNYSNSLQNLFDLVKALNIKVDIVNLDLDLATKLSKEVDYKLKVFDIWEGDANINYNLDYLPF